MTATRKRNIMVLGTLLLFVVLASAMSGSSAGLLIPVQLLQLWPLVVVAGVVAFGYQMMASLRRIENHLERAAKSDFEAIHGS